MRRRSYLLQLFLFALVLMVLVLCALCLGRYGQSPLDTLKILFSRILPIERTWDDSVERVVFLVRLPRIGAAILVGAALAISGITYQGIFKNPLVSPDLLGVSSGASVGAALAILSGLSAGLIQAGALVGGLTAVLLTVTIPKLMRNSSTLMLVLAGIIVQGFMSAVMGLLKYVADPESQLAEITYWQMGRISNTSSQDIAAVLPAMAVAAALLLALRWRINILSLGDAEAESLGVNLRVIRGMAVVCSTVLTACAVCISGVVSWIGLIIPHMCRMVVGPDNTKTMPVSLLAGASFLLTVDTLARTLSSTEIPLSMITGFIGAPLYAWLLFHQRVKVK
ncbi:FecCD family ABC transporter permease [Anaerotruncus colihominis]|uniref:FecCD family ABC transporter permease n=1 Tax=Anaerotruncus colihominis TaxID=169435 RepID=UPI002670E743|nr:iron ABC transporter permease [Anaerotruncus colihominis]